MLIAAIGVAVVVMMLYYRAVLTELTLQISSERTKLNEEISEGTRLAAELESKVSLRNVEEYCHSVSLFLCEKCKILSCSP